MSWFENETVADRGMSVEAPVGYVWASPTSQRAATAWSFAPIPEPGPARAASLEERWNERMREGWHNLQFLFGARKTRSAV